MTCERVMGSPRSPNSSLWGGGIVKLISSDGAEVMNGADILKVLVSYYEHLYASKFLGAAMDMTDYLAIYHCRPSPSIPNNFWSNQLLVLSWRRCYSPFLMKRL